MNTFLICWHVAEVGKGQDELLGELLAGQCDVVLVDRDGHRLVQVVPLVVSAYEIVKCRKKIAVPVETSQHVFQSGTGMRSMTLEVMKRRPIAMMD